MQISRIIPVILNIILSEQQSQKQTLQQQAVKKNALPQMLPPSAAKPDNPSPQYKTNDPSEPQLFPLPLKTTLFPNTQFFAFRRPVHEQKKHQDENEETGIAFSLSSTNLGRLFFTLTKQSETINITCHTEHKKIAAHLASRSSELKQHVENIGFNKVIFKCTVLDRKFLHQRTEFSCPGLLDQKI